MVNEPRTEMTDQSGRTSGIWVVCGILGLGLVSILALWLYTDMHTAPFLALRDAIHAEYPSSAPQVEGGQRKIQKRTPRILRVTVRVSWDPRETDDEVADMVDRIVALADEHHGLGQYDLFDVYLVWFRPERKAVSRHEQRAVSGLIEAGRVRPAGD